MEIWWRNRVHTVCQLVTGCRCRNGWIPEQLKLHDGDSKRRSTGVPFFLFFFLSFDDIRSDSWFGIGLIDDGRDLYVSIEVGTK